MKISSRWIVAALLLPVIGSAQVRIETAGGFVSSSFARDIGGRTAGLYGSNVTALKSGVLSSSGATNAIIGTLPLSGAFNAISMALSNAPAVTVAFFVKLTAFNNSDTYNNILLITRASSSGGSAQWVSCVSNQVLIGGRSVAADTFQQLVSPVVTMTGRWVHVVAVFNYGTGTQQIYLNGALATNAAATFASTTFKPSPNTTAAQYHDTLLCDSSTRTRACNAQISPVLIVGRAWTLADVLDDRRRRGKDFLNP